MSPPDMDCSRPLRRDFFAREPHLRVARTAGARCGFGEPLSHARAFYDLDYRRGHYHEGVCTTRSEATVGGLSIWHWLIFLGIVAAVITLFRKSPRSRPRDSRPRDIAADLESLRHAIEAARLKGDITAEKKALEGMEALVGLTAEQAARLKEVTGIIGGVVTNNARRQQK